MTLVQAQQIMSSSVSGEVSRIAYRKFLRSLTRHELAELLAIDASKIDLKSDWRDLALEERNFRRVIGQK
jgi:hypothetical protein